MGAQTAAVFRPARVAPVAAAPAPRPRLTSCILAAADLTAVSTAHLLAAIIWPAGFSHLLGFSELLGLLAFTYAALGLYSAAGLGPVEELRRAVLGAAFVAALLLLQRSWPALVMSSALTAASVPLARSAVRSLFAKRTWWGAPVVILGAGHAASVLIGQLHQHPEIGFKPVASFDANLLEQARTLAKSLKVRHVLVAIPGMAREDLVWLLDDWGAVFPHVILIPNLFGLASLWASTRDLGGTLGLEMRQNLLIPFNRWTKRAIDLAGALILGFLALPILAAAATCIKLFSRGSMFYSQEREGEKGRGISVVKLRTMRPDAEAALRAVLAQSHEIRAEWARRFKLRDDPRILPGVGKFLRKTSLDELPQLWSVLKGEMSLVGPRPFPRYHLDGFGQRFRALRGRVKPGLTGLWQVSDRADGDLEVQEILDTYYIRNWSLWLDLYIMARTVRAVLFPKGAY